MRFRAELPDLGPVTTTPRPLASLRTTPGRSPSFQQALRGLGSAVDRGEALIAQASRGNVGGLDSAQLIALQAGIYRYSEAVDLLAKLVDRASNAVRSVISPH